MAERRRCCSDNRGTFNLNATLDKIIPENDTNPSDLAYLEQQADSIVLTDALHLLNTYWN